MRKFNDLVAKTMTPESQARAAAKTKEMIDDERVREEFDARAHVHAMWRKRGCIALNFTELVEMVQAAYAAGRASAAEREQRLQDSLRLLIDGLALGKTNYSRDHGMPNPTPAFPVEQAFIYRDWARVLQAVAEASRVLEETK